VAHAARSQPARGDAAGEHIAGAHREGGQDAKISGDEDTRRLVTSGLHAIINCVRQGDHDIFTIRIVAGNDDAHTRAIMEEIRSGMLSGVLD
jgi:hypothetical protein